VRTKIFGGDPDNIGLFLNLLCIGCEDGQHCDAYSEGVFHGFFCLHGVAQSFTQSYTKIIIYVLLQIFLRGSLCNFFYLHGVAQSFTKSYTEVYTELHREIFTSVVLCVNYFFSFENGNTSEGLCAAFIISSSFLAISGFSAAIFFVSPTSFDKS